MPVQINPNKFGFNQVNESRWKSTDLSERIKQIDDLGRINQAKVYDSNESDESDENEQSVNENVSSGNYLLFEFSAQVKQKNIDVGIYQVAEQGLKKQLKILDQIKEEIEQFENNPMGFRYEDQLHETLSSLINEVDQIAKNTQINGQYPLLQGGTQSRSFNPNLQPTDIQHIGYYEEKDLRADIFRTIDEDNNTITLALASDYGKEIVIGPNPGEGLGQLSRALNSVTHLTGIRSEYEVEFTPFEESRAIQAGTTPDNFAINGVNIGKLDVADHDRTKMLRNTINEKLAGTGVEASIDSEGGFVLSSEDGRAIEIKGDFQQLGAMNIVDQGLFRPEHISTKANFEKGDTLSQYSFSTDKEYVIEQISMREYDGDAGLVNVYLQLNDEDPILVGEKIETSYNNAWKTSYIPVDQVKANQALIRPLDAEGNEGNDKGLGGWWNLDNVGLRTIPENTLMEAGEIQLESLGRSGAYDTTSLLDELGIEEVQINDVLEKREYLGEDRKQFDKLLSAMENVIQENLNTIQVELYENSRDESLMEEVKNFHGESLENSEDALAVKQEVLSEAGDYFQSQINISLEKSRSLLLGVMGGSPERDETPSGSRDKISLLSQADNKESYTR